MQIHTVTGPGTVADAMSVRFVSGEAYEVTVRSHRVSVDQPTASGGADTAPTPTELYVASLATCVAFYAGRCLTHHGHSRDGLAISAALDMASDRPARVSAIRVAVRVPAGVPPKLRPALEAVISHCIVHNTLANPPDVAIELVG